MTIAEAMQRELSSDGITSLSATELVACISRGEVSCEAAVNAHIGRIERENPALNAVVVERYEAAREEARAADRARAAGKKLGELHGLPVTVKECLDVTGCPTTCGIESRMSPVAERDDDVVAKWRQAGAIVVGKTNVAQLLLFTESDNPVYGRSNNPWNLERSPGGSSGGQAAIIAAGGSVLGLGTDIGGSVRSPAAACGIASIKPTTGRLSDSGRLSVPFGQRGIPSQVGVLARTVEDVALGLSVASSGESSSREYSPSLGDFTSVPVQGLRVAWYTDDGLLRPCPAAVRAVEHAVAGLAERGAVVREWVPPDLSLACDLFFGILAADGFASERRALGRSRRDYRIFLQEFALSSKGLTHAIMCKVLDVSGRKKLLNIVRNYGRQDADHYFCLIERLHEYELRLRAAFQSQHFDVVISPPFPLPAIRHGASAELITSGSYTLLYNVLGWPSGVVPFTRVRPGEEIGERSLRDVMDRVARKTEEGSAGLPIGVQVGALPFHEHVVLAAMTAIEQVARATCEHPGAPPARG